jgi:TRAP-type uncharacterized transport system fused permease subunit
MDVEEVSFGEYLKQIISQGLKEDLMGGMGREKNEPIIREWERQRTIRLAATKSKAPYQKIIRSGQLLWLSPIVLLIGILMISWEVALAGILLVIPIVALKVFEEFDSNRKFREKHEFNYGK